MTDPTIKNSAIIIRVMCAIFFLAFSFAYLYYYQADVLAVAQHILSGGRTCYNQTIGAVLITFVLFLLHWGIATLVRLPRLLYAQTYFFPLLLLLFLTELRPDCNNRFAFGIWFWLLPLLLILHGGILWIFHQMKLSQDGYTSKGFFSRTLWVNLLQMVIMSFLVGQIGAGNDVFHYRAKAERALMKNDYTTALNIGSNALSTDTSLTMIRIYSLSRKGLLGERLFEYPLVGGSSALLPHGNHARLLMYPEHKIYTYLGLRIQQPMKPMDYLRFLERHHLLKRPAVDYLLCGYLLDRDLDSFVRSLPRYYDVKGSLPKHYREALTLYTHLHSAPSIIYHNNVMDADFQDYQDMERANRDKVIRRTKLRDIYGNTYWYYYQYGQTDR